MSIFSHFHAFACAVVSVEYYFSFLDLVNISFQTQPRCYSFKTPLLNTLPCPAPAWDLTLWCSIGSTCLALLLVWMAWALHRTVLPRLCISLCWVQCLSHQICRIIFKCILNAESLIVRFLRWFYRFILFPLPSFLHLHLGILDTKAGSFWNCCSDTFAILPAVDVLISSLFTKNYHKKEVEKYQWPQVNLKAGLYGSEVCLLTIKRICNCYCLWGTYYYVSGT